MNRSAYLDNQTFSRPFSGVMEQLVSVQREIWQAPFTGRSVEDFLSETIRAENKKICKLLGAAADDEFVFTSSGEEAVRKLFLALYLDVAKETGRTHLLFSPGDPWASEPGISWLEKLGYTPKTAAVNARGQITAQALEEMLRPRTALLSLPWADPLTGVIQPLADLAEICNQKEVLFHVDASATLGKLFFRFQDLDVDFLTFSGRSLHAPAASGGILVKGGGIKSTIREREELAFAPLLSGLSLSQEMLYQSIDHVCLETARLRGKLEDELKTHLPDVTALFAESERVPHICAIAFPGVHAEALLALLQKDGIFAALCQGSFSKLLQACNLDKSLAFSTLSFSLSHDTSEEEIDYAIERITSHVKKLRSYSTQIFE